MASVDTAEVEERTAVSTGTAQQSGDSLGFGEVKIGRSPGPLCATDVWSAVIHRDVILAQDGAEAHVQTICLAPIALTAMLCC
jgi:hypothetical protein